MHGQLIILSKLVLELFLNPRRIKRLEAYWLHNCIYTIVREQRKKQFRFFMFSPSNWHLPVQQFYIKIKKKTASQHKQLKNKSILRKSRTKPEIRQSITAETQWVIQEPIPNSSHVWANDCANIPCILTVSCLGV